MPFTIIRQDITKMNVGAIVNAANTDLLMGGGVCGAIFKGAGEKELIRACARLSPIRTGEAVLTSAFKLPAKYIIHTAGPVYDQGDRKRSEELLRLSYINSLQLAKDKGLESIAFPLISSGIYGYPKKEALQTASAVIKDFVRENEMDVYLIVYDEQAFSISKKLLGEVESYIDENYVEERYFLPLEGEESLMSPYLERVSRYKERKSESFRVPNTIENLLQSIDDSFSTFLMKLIDKKEKTDVQVYKKANIDRKLFSKIRAGNGYMPSKRTILALAVSLELSLEETDDLLERAGYALSPCQKFDIIVEFFILNKRYNIYEINEVLFKYDQPLLGGKYQ